MPDPNVHDSTLVCQVAEGARLILVGLGGIGGSVLHYLALFLHSLRIPLRLVLVDGDTYVPRDQARQSFQSLGNKAEVKAAETITQLGPSELSIVPVPEYLTSENIGRLVRSGDYVLLCVDNHPTRKLISDHCQTLTDVALFSGGNDGIDPPRERGTYGNVQIAIRKHGQDATAPLTRYHPEIANPQGKHPGDVPCGELAQTVGQIAFTNLAVASAMLNAFFAYACSRLTYQEVKLDILDARMLPQFPLPPDRVPKP